MRFKNHCRAVQLTDDFLDQTNLFGRNQIRFVHNDDVRELNLVNQQIDNVAVVFIP